VDRNGQDEPIAAPADVYVWARLSPDGTRVALDAQGDDGAVWIWDFVKQTRTRLIVGEGRALSPIWTPDGTRIAYRIGRAIDWKASNNTGSAERLAEPGSAGADPPIPYFFTPDGAALVFRDRTTPGTGDDLAMIPVHGDGALVWRLTGTFHERNAELSPDGRWMTYQSDESGEWQVYVRPFPRVEDDQVVVSNDGGVMPLWSPDGRELFYLRPGEPVQLIAVSVSASTADGRFTFGERKTLFDLDLPYYAIGNPRNYDVSPDGQRFLVIRETGGDAGEEARPEITVVLNWFEELKARVPVP